MLPEEFQSRMRLQLRDEYEEFLKGLEGERHRALRVNPLKGGGGPQEARDRFLALSPWHLEAVPWEEEGFYYSHALPGPGRHPYHEAGVYYIQEPSAMAPVVFLGAEPGEKVLDLCAAPGGKSTQIAGRMRGRGLLVSNEIHPQRARVLSENVERLGIRNCLVLSETPERLTEVFSGYFDRILVDAPCSGEGMFRKNENAGEEWSPENVERCAARQDGILDCAAAMLRPGGRLVYSTCTFAPLEDEGSVSRLLCRHPEMKVSGRERRGGGSGRNGGSERGGAPCRLGLCARKSGLGRGGPRFPHGKNPPALAPQAAGRGTLSGGAAKGWPPNRGRGPESVWDGAGHPGEGVPGISGVRCGNFAGQAGGDLSAFRGTAVPGSQGSAGPEGPACAASRSASGCIEKEPL